MHLDDFTGLRWNDRHTSELGLVVVSDGSRYDASTLSDIENYTNEIPGYDGEYYYNSNFKSKTITVNLAFDSITETQRREIRNWLATKELHDLIFDEAPYKAYSAKITGKPEFKFVCFDEYKEEDNTLVTERIYKGEGTITFYIPVPYAHTARNFNGKYMKYLDQLEFYTNHSAQFLKNPKFEKTIEVGVSDSLPIEKKAVVELLEIQGNTVNTENNFNRIFISKEQPLTISIQDKEWGTFNLINIERSYLDYINEKYYDSVTFVPINQNNLENGKYVLVKKTGSIELNSKDDTDILVPSKFDESKGNQIYKIKLSTIFKNKNKEKDWGNIAGKAIYSEDKVPLIIQGFKPSAGDNTDVTNFYKIESYKINYLTKKKVPEEITLISSKKIDELNIVYPLENEEQYDLILNDSSSNILQYNASKNLIVTLSSNYADTENSNTKIIQKVRFRQIPILYNNLDDWKEESGLQPFKIVDNEEYDVCNMYKGNLYYKIINKGDLDTPFKLRLPLNKVPYFDDQEITFVLQDNMDFNYNVTYEKVGSFNDFINTVPYYIVDKDQELNKIKELKSWYFIEMEYENNRLIFRDLNNEFLKVNFNEKDFYFIKENNVNNQILHTFNLKFNSNNIDYKFVNIFKNQYTSKELGINTFLEIDTEKQSINLIIQSIISKKETVVPVYFLLDSGNLFKIPKNFDNLYLFIYNKSVNSENIIRDSYYVDMNSTQEIIHNNEIDYKYLYY